ncbi:DUF4132 domain-containing protein [Actinoplanes sp. NPDC024001]|uniref:DUF7737 domain-containing protein n=1 Tax=Actinoplanes sp. NPDC024001 TaxID=3154598 RepID=UPI0033DF58C4
MLPDQYAEEIRATRQALWELVEQARHSGKAGDRTALRSTAAEIRHRIDRGDNLTIGNLAFHLDDIVTELDTVYDAAFPPGRPDDLTALLDAPWPSARRRAMLADFLGRDVRHHLLLDEVAQTTTDPVLLRLLILSPLGRLRRESVVRVLDALHHAGRLDASVVERAITDDRYLGRALTRSPGTDAVRDHVDALLWRLVSAPDPVDWDELPMAPGPRGLRFVRLALSWTGDPRIADHLGAAELTVPERAALLDLMRDRSTDEQRRVWDWRTRAGDAEVLLPLFGLERAAPLMRLIRAMPDGHEAFRQDRAALLAALEHAGPDTARRLLRLMPSELVSAALGDNRAAVLKRLKSNALQGIAAFGMLPLAPGETVLDRYLALRDSAKKGARLGPNRRHSHAAAIDVALDHLAQVAGVADASRLEWDCEVRLATETTTEADAGEYRLALRFDGADPVLTVSRAGKQLKSVPAAVRADPAFVMVREHQERLRDQARRMCTGLVERLVATAGTLTPDELTRLRSLPAGAAMLPALLWRDTAGTIGLLDDVDTSGPLTAVHPVELLERQSLAAWQEEIVRRRLRQPVKQVFRELYVPTPAERDAVDVSQRFAGQVVDGKVAGQLLSARGWSTHDQYADFQATRPAGIAPTSHLTGSAVTAPSAGAAITANPVGSAITAPPAGSAITAQPAGTAITVGLRCDFHGYFGLGNVLIGEVRFLSAGTSLPLADVPPAVFSEVMRDLDLVVSVAGTSSGTYVSPAQATSRAQLLAALITDLGLTRVTVEGTTALIRGSRATYRVHLTSGSIHVEPGGYLCIVPARFGATPHRRLFLPFADDDRMTSVILSKVLLLANDESITDPSILSQLSTLT